MGILNYEVVSLNAPTRGQAETVFLGLQKVNNKNELTIFNIDTLRSNFKFPEFYINFEGNVLNQHLIYY